MKIYKEDGFYVFDVPSRKFTCLANDIFHAKEQFLKHVDESVIKELDNIVEKYKQGRK